MPPRLARGPTSSSSIQLADMAAYHALVQRLFTDDANVRNVKAYFSVHRAKFETRVPLRSRRELLCKSHVTDSGPRPGPSFSH